MDAVSLLRAVAESPSPDDAFRAVEAAAGEAIGHRLFTVMHFDAAAMQVQRVYSSNPRAYPTGGRKAKRDTAWGRQVLEQGRPFIGASADDIRAHFGDHELILGLGLASILNVPVRVCGCTVGTMNLLHAAGHYHAGQLPTGWALAGVLAGPLLLAAKLPAP